MTRIARTTIVVVILLVTASAAIGVAVWRSLVPTKPPALVDSAPRSLPGLADVAGWVNGGPVAGDSIHGHVTALVVWSDTDPLALALLPDVEAWHRAYTRFGLRVIGVHAPDFSYATDTSVTARIARTLGLTFPIALDPRYRVANQWPGDLPRPALFVADASGRVILVAGADRWAEIDRTIRAQLASLEPAAGIDTGMAPPRPDPGSERTEYLGTSRAQSGPLVGAEPGRARAFTAQFRFQEEGQTGIVHPVGWWTPEAEGVIAARVGPSTYLAVRQDPGQVAAVIGPPPSGHTRVWVLGDEAWLARDAAGEDVRFDDRGASYVDVTEPRVYAISRSAARRVLKFSPDEVGTTFYALVFTTPER